MGESLAVFTVVSILLLQYPTASHAGLWTINIDESPAPLPQDGPPFSAHASRDRALLPGQICGIVGAYLGSVFLVGGLLLTIGRRLRRQALAVHRNPPLEMVKPVMAYGVSPASPGSQRSWYSPRKLKKKSSGPGSVRSDTNLGSPGLESNASFDPNVLEADRAAREQELENLYAAALAEEATKSDVNVMSEEETLEDVASPMRGPRRPPRLLTTALSAAHLQLPSPTSPASTRSPVRAIYPPDSPYRHSSTPASPIRAEYPISPLTPRYPSSPGQHSSSGNPNHHLSHSSSLRSQTSGGHGKRFRKTLRSLHISNPIPISPGNSSDQEARTPLTPRYYTDPGAPPSPPTRSEAPTTPATHKSSIYEEQPAGSESIDRIRDLPMVAPQRKSDYQYHSVPQAGQALVGTIPENGISTPTLGALPFRSLSNQQQLHLQPGSARALPSPGLNTKVTYLERRRDLLNPPRTGAATPYSPYMPFTPVTPVTPHLMSRAERRQQQREAGRRAPAEEDRVIEEDEMWGSGY